MNRKGTVFTAILLKYSILTYKWMELGIAKGVSFLFNRIKGYTLRTY